MSRERGAAARGAAKAAATSAPSPRAEREPARVSNQMQQWLHGGGNTSSIVVGRLDDRAESDARGLAERVVVGGRTPCACGGSCSSCHGAKESWSAARSRRSGEPLGLGQRGYFEPRLGVPLDGVRIHRDSKTAALAEGLGARAFALGGDIGFGGGQYAPETQSGRRLLAHELAHVALGHSGLRRDDAPFQPPYASPFKAYSPSFPSPSAGARCPGGCHQPNPPAQPNWDFQFPTGKGVPIKSPRELLAEQPKTISKELEGIEQNILGTRSAMFDQLEKDRTAPPRLIFGGFDRGDPSLGSAVPPDLKLKYAAAVASATALQAALEGAGAPKDPAFFTLARVGDIPIELQEDARASLNAYYLALLDFANAADQAQIEREQRQRAARDAEESAFPQRGPPCPNCHTPNPAPAIRFVPPPRPLSATPKQVAKNVPGVISLLAAASTAEQWSQAERDFTTAVAGMDNLLILALPEGSTEAQNLEYLSDQRAKLEQFQHEHPSAVPIPAIFYPKDRLTEVKDPNGPPGATVEIPQAIPWRFYLYHSNDQPTVQRHRTGGPGEWILKDLTSPKGGTYIEETFGLLDSALDPPFSLFKQLDNKYRFPEGKLYWTYPSGAQGVLETTEPWTASDWLGAIGMTLAAIALIAGTVATLGLAAPATIPALAGIATAAGIGAAGFGIASTVTGYQEKKRYGLLTEEDKEHAVFSIALDIIGALSLGLGRLAAVAELGTEAAETGVRASRFASTLAALNGRYFFMITKAAAVTKVAGLGADFTQLLTTTADFVKAFSAIRSQKGLSDDAREKALIKLVATSLLTGALLTVSIRGSLKEAKGGILKMTGVDEEGRIIVGEEASKVARGKAGPPEPPPRTIASHLEGGEPLPGEGWSRKTAGPELDPNLPGDRVEVRFVQDEAGRILDAQTYFGKTATEESKQIHEALATKLRTESEELRNLVYDSRSKFGGEPPPLELQLEQKKLFDEMKAIEKKVAGGGLTKAQVEDATHKLNFLQTEIDKAKAAIADPALRSAYPKGVVAVPVKPTELPKFNAAGERVAPKGYPNPPDGHQYYLRDNGEFDLRPKSDYKGAARFTLEEVNGRYVASNREQIAKLAGRELTPELKATLRAQGYVVQENGVIRRPAGHAGEGRPRLVPLEIDANGRLAIFEGAETAAEVQTRLRAALQEGQRKKLETLEASPEAADKKVVLVEGLYDTGVTWDKVLTGPKQKQLKVLLQGEGVLDADIDRLINGLVGKKGTIKIVLGTDPIRTAAKYRSLFEAQHGPPAPGVEVHHGDPLYLGGGHDPTALFGLPEKPHDALHGFVDQLTLPSANPLGPSRLQAGELQNKAKPFAKQAAAVVDPATGAVRFDFLE
jgi:hypothetical protein